MSEPIENLQRELGVLRALRRDSATLALASGYVYEQDAAEPSRFARLLGWLVTIYALARAVR
jgi:hypothetical protein